MRKPRPAYWFACLLLLFLWVTNVSAGQSEPIVAISRGADGETLAGGVSLQAINADGSVIVFSSSAVELAQAPASGPVNNLFVYDALADSTTLITPGIDGPANGTSFGADISADGRFVAFVSRSSNLIANDLNQFADVFVFDRSSNTLSLVSTNEFGNPSNGNSSTVQISDDGRHVSFYSRANNLDLGSSVVRQSDVPMVLDRDPDQNGVFDELGTLRPQRLVPDSVPEPDTFNTVPSMDMSQNGRYIAFTEQRPSLTVDAVVPANRYLYLYDRDVDADGILDEPGQTRIDLVSRDDNGSPLPASAASLSADGTKLATVLRGTSNTSSRFRSVVLDLDPNQTGSPNPALAQATEVNAGSNISTNPALSRSGRYLIYGQFVDPTDFSRNDIYLLDRQTATSTLVTLSLYGRAANASSQTGLPTDDGSRVVFESSARNLVALDTNGARDIFIADPSQPIALKPLPRECDDRLDNDDDGEADLNDSGCSAPNDDSESQVQSPLQVISTAIVGERDGNATLLNSQGIAGDNPSITVSRLNNVIAAHVSEAYDPVLNRMRDFIQLATFDGVYWRLDTIAPGVTPSVAVDVNEVAHIAFHDAREGDLRYATLGTDGSETFTVDDAGLTGQKPIMLLTQNEEPWIVYHDVDDRTIRMWRGFGNPQINLATDIEPCGFNAVLTPDDEVRMVFSGCVDDTLQLVSRTGNLLIRETLFEGAGVGTMVDIALDVYDQPVITFQSAVNDAVMIARPNAGSWSANVVAGTDNSQYAEILFLADGISPKLIVSDNGALRQIRQTNTGDENLVLGPQHGFVGRFSAAQGPDGKIHVAYQDISTRNLLHTTSDSQGWQLRGIGRVPAGIVKDLDFFDHGNGQAPQVVTLLSPSPGAIGLIYVQGRFPFVGWDASTPTSAAPQDDFDVKVVRSRPTLSRIAAHFDNVAGELNYLFETAPEIWGSELVTTVPRFSQIRAIQTFFFGGNPVIVGVISGDAETKTPDQPIAFVRRSGSWVESRLTTSPTSFIGAAAATRGARGPVYLAYYDDQLGDLRMATFDGQNWTDEGVDFAGTNIFSRAIAITTTVKQLRGQLPVSVPVIAYLNVANNRIRIASKVNGWQTHEYDDALSGINNLALALESESRLKPMVLAGTWDGDLYLYRRSGNSIQMAERENVTSDYDGSNPIFLGLNPSPTIAYTNASNESILGLGSAAPGLPAARGGTQPGAAVVNNYICLGGDDDTNVKGSGFDSNDESILRRWETQFARTDDGQRYINFFRQDFPTAFNIVANDAGLFMDANAALQNFMPGIQAMVDGQGSAVVITQEMIDDGRDIWERLADRDSGPLSEFIESELTRWNQLDDFVGMTFEQWAIAIGVNPAITAPSDNLFQNGFE